MDKTYKALAHPVRRQILQMLRKRAHTAGELADAFALSKPTLSGHFNVLREAGFVTVERDGTTLHYRLNMTVAEELVEHLLALLAIDETEKHEPLPKAKPKGTSS